MSGGYRGGSSMMGPRSDPSVCMRQSARKLSVPGYGKKAATLKAKKRARQAVKSAAKKKVEIMNAVTNLAAALAVIDWSEGGQ